MRGFGGSTRNDEGNLIGAAPLALGHRSIGVERWHAEELGGLRCAGEPGREGVKGDVPEVRLLTTGSILWSGVAGEVRWRRNRWRSPWPEAGKNQVVAAIPGVRLRLARGGSSARRGGAAGVRLR